MTKTKATALRACSAHIHMVLCARWAKKMMGMKTQTTATRSERALICISR